MFVAIVVFLFLGSWRATLIPLIAVPVSVIGTFAVLLVMGYSANTMSLLAMVLAIGIVVDDAIVVVENVAITLVLLSVFVPLVFIPGISGELFRQFSVTISVSMLLSAINSLTLSPALCGVMLRHTGAKRGIMAWVSRRIDNVRDGYAAIVTKTLRFSVLSLALIAGFGVGAWNLAQRTPTGFLPEEDQGVFFTVVQLPDAASVARTHHVVEQVEELLRGMPQVQDVASVVGYSFLDSFSPSNSAFVIATLKPFEDRKAAADSAQALIAKTFGAAQQIRGADVLPFNLPPVIGLSTTGGFEYMLESLQGADPATLGSTARALIGAANADPRLSRVFSTYTAGASSQPSPASLWRDSRSTSTAR